MEAWAVRVAVDARSILRQVERIELAVRQGLAPRPRELASVAARIDDLHRTVLDRDPSTCSGRAVGSLRAALEDIASASSCTSRVLEATEAAGPTEPPRS